MHSFARAVPLISTALSINFHQSVSNFLQSIIFRSDTCGDTVPPARSPPMRKLAREHTALCLYIKLMVDEPISFSNTVSRNKVIAPHVPVSLEKASRLPFAPEISFSAGGSRFTYSWFPFRRIRTTERSKFDRFCHFRREIAYGHKFPFLLISILLVLRK